MDYNYKGNIINDGVITVYDMPVRYENEAAIIEEVTINLSGTDEEGNPDGITFQLEGDDIPSTTNYNAIKAWAKNALKPYEV